MLLFAHSSLSNFIPVLSLVVGLLYMQTKIFQVNQSWGTKRRWVLHEANDKHLVSISGGRGVSSQGITQTAFLGTSSECLLKFNRVYNAGDLFISEHSEYFTKHQLTYSLLTPWSRSLLEKITGLQLAKKLPAVYGTRRFIAAFTSARHLSLFWDWSI